MGNFCYGYFVANNCYSQQNNVCQYYNIMTDKPQCSYMILRTGRQCRNAPLHGYSTCGVHTPRDSRNVYISEVNSHMTGKHRLLGSGSYGCVYRPPIKCKYHHEYNQKYKDQVMKVMHIESALNEIEISVVVNSIDPNHQYFVSLSNDWCTLDTSDPKLQLCKSYVKDIDAKKGQDKHYHGHFIEYAGIPIDEYVKSGTSVKKLIKLMKHLVNGLVKLHAAGICHLDIKDPNIMVSNNTPRLIDFGISKFTDEYTNEDITVFYESYPPFLSYVSKGSDEIKMRQTYDALFKKFDKNYAAGIVGHDPLIEYNQLLQTSGSVQKYALDVIKPNLNKVDTYMLGAVMRRSLYYVPNEHTKLPIYKDFRQLCIMCMNPSVELQYNTTDIINYYRKREWLVR